MGPVIEGTLPERCLRQCLDFHRVDCTVNVPGTELMRRGRASEADRDGAGDADPSGSEKNEKIFCPQKRRDDFECV